MPRSIINSLMNFIFYKKGSLPIFSGKIFSKSSKKMTEFVKYHGVFYESSSCLLNNLIRKFRDLKTANELQWTINALRKNPKMYVDEIGDYEQEELSLESKVARLKERISRVEANRANKYLQILFIFQLERKRISSITPRQLFWLSATTNSWLHERDPVVFVKGFGDKYPKNRINDIDKEYSLLEYKEQVHPYTKERVPYSYFDLDEKVYRPKSEEYATEFNNLLEQLYAL